MWQFRRIRETAIKTMASVSMDLVDKIVIARRFDISAWLIPALNELVQREKPVDFLEGNRLGMEWVLKVAELRECDANTTAPQRRCQNCHHTGPPRCDSCHSTTANRCGSCNVQFGPASGTANTRGSRNDVDYSHKIREVFGLERGK